MFVRTDENGFVILAMEREVTLGGGDTIVQDVDGMTEVDFDGDVSDIRFYKLVENALVLDADAKQAYEESLKPPQRNGITDSELLSLILKAVTIPEPPAQREGEILVPHYEAAGNSIVWTFEPDPNYQPTADGSYLHPFTFVAPMAVTSGLWYTDGEDIWECVETGLAESFTAPWFDVIG